MIDETEPNKLPCLFAEIKNKKTFVPLEVHVPDSY